jgi:hypothetical protein
MKLVRIWLYPLLLASGALLAQQSVPEHDGPRRVVTTTRLVAQLSELESQWFKALQQKDEPALRNLLGEDFQVWSPQASGPMPREEWQRNAFVQDLRSFHFQNMAARSLNDDTAVISFVLNESVQSHGKSRVENSFVVDIWSKHSDHWVCTDRYAAPLSNISAPKTEADHKPSGKP